MNLLLKVLKQHRFSMQFLRYENDVRTETLNFLVKELSEDKILKTEEILINTQTTIQY